MRRAGWLLVAATLVIGVAVVVPATSSVAAPITPFVTRFQTNDNGAVAIVGNTLETCPPTAANCAAARAGTARLNNNSFAMINLKTPGDVAPANLNSSAARLNLPDDATVLFAGLYWGARLSAGASGTAGTGNRRVMSLRAPGDAGYRAVAATADFGPTTGDGAYQEFADVTGIVRAGGVGTYWGANVVAGTGEDRYAGWSLVVAYRSADLPLRNLTVFDGFADVGQGNPQNITVNGFLAPRSGPVDAQVGLVAYEGDYATSGDSASLTSPGAASPTQLGTSLSPGSNFFNGTDDLNGASATGRDPADLNMLGYDIKNVGASGAISNGATSATLALTSTGDRYFPGVLTTSINLYAPDFTPSTKTAVDESGNDPAEVGDTVTYTVALVNAGQDPAAGSVATDPVPPNTSYVPGSLQVLTGPNAGAKTDQAGDDQAEYDAAARAVRVRVGTGATAAAGGTIGVAQSTSFRFQVTVDAPAAGTTVTNQATLDYVAQTIGQRFAYQPRPADVSVAERADLSLTKSVTPDPAAPGGPLTTTLTVRNAGPSPARGVEVTDPLPDGVTAVVSGTSPSCQLPVAPSRTVTCTVGTLGVNAVATLIIAGTTDPASADPSVTNVATVSSDTPDPNPANDTAGATADLAPQADLSVTKTASADTVTPGGGVTFTVIARNVGPSVARSVSITDAVDDPALTLDSADPAAGSGATCDTASGQAVQCQVAQLAPGASVVLTVHATLSSGADAGTAYTDTATVSGQTPDPTSANNAASATVRAGPASADLRLEKDAPAGGIAGRTVTYTLTATNLGPSDAAGAVVTDPLPAGLTATSVSTTRGTCIGTTTISCDLGPLVAGAPGQDGASAVITVTATLPAGLAPARITNTASVAGPTADPVVTDNTASAVTTVSDEADVSITKDGTPNPVVPGQPITYTITVANDGPSTATQVQVVDQLPAEFAFVRATPSAGTCTGSGPVTCALGDVGVGAQATISVVMNVPPDFVSGRADEVATVSSATPDPVAANNRAEWIASPFPSADVSLTKRGPASAEAGARVTYTLTASNAGPSNAADVVVTDPVPPGTTFVSATAPCALVGTAVRCVLGTLTAGTDRTLTVTVATAADAAPGSMISNTATLTTSTADPSPTDNSDRVDTPVTTLANLRVTKTAAPGSGPAGSVQFFTVAITNDGPSVARDVTLIDQFDADAVAAQPTGANCTNINGEIQCTLADPLAPGATQTVQLPIVLASFATPGTYLNHATVSTTTPETTLADNAATAPVLVTDPEVDLAISKQALTDPLVAGGTFSYQLDVTNNQPADFSYGSDAPDTVITDTLPAGLTATSASTTQGSCTVTGATVTCDVGTVSGPIAPSPPAPVTVTIVGTVAADLVGPVTNAASVTSGAAEQVPANNTASTTTAVRQDADLTVSKTADEDPIVAGGTAAYTIAVTDSGPSDAAGVVLTDVLPAGVTFSADDSDPSCAPGPGGVTCSLGTITAGTTRAVRIVGQLDPASPATSLTNIASVTSPLDPDPANNTASVTTGVTRAADLQLTKTADSATPSVGSTLTYLLTLTNAGPSAAAAPVITDPLPAGVTLVSLTPNGDVCSSAGTPVVVTCRAPTLAAGAALTVEIKVGLPDGLALGPLANRASATSATADPDPTNDSDTTTVSVEALANASITKTLLTDPIVAGRPVQYRLTAANAGPASAPDVVLTDTLPTGTTLAAAVVESPPGQTCSSVAQEGNIVLTCPVGRLAVGAQASALVTLATSPGLTGDLANTAAVGSGGLDRAIANNLSTATGPVVAPAPTDVAATLTIAPPTVQPGAAVTLVAGARDNGPALATSVAVTVAVPAGLVVGPLPAGCTATGQTVRCALPDLDPSAATVTLPARVAADAAPGTVLTATARTTHLEPDTVPPNDTATASITVIGPTASPPPGGPGGGPGGGGSGGGASGGPGIVEPPTSSGDGSLPFTGVAVRDDLALAGLLLAAGLVLLGAARRRRRST